MTTFILQNVDNLKYVAATGTKHSYTRRLEKARLYPTKEIAEANRCGNERILSFVPNGIQ